MERAQSQIEEHIKMTAASTDKLIARLDTLTSRIDTARTNENAELVEYYERQFAEVSVEFLDGVETILDEWYALKGETRPSAETENLSPETLESIHNTVVSIVRGLPPDMPETRITHPAAPKTDGAEHAVEPRAPGKPRHRVDVTG